jgi:predicted ATPase
MPLTGIRLKNFKCFADSGDVPLAPLTVIFGRNNTGKSSILQSLLLLRQTLDSSVEDVPRLNLRGPLYPAGAYADVVHQHRSKQHVVMECSLLGRRAGTVELEFSSDEPRAPRLTRLRVTSPDTEPVEIRRGRGAGGPYELAVGGKVQGGPRDANFGFARNRFLPFIGPELAHRGRPNLRREGSRFFADRSMDDLADTLRGLRSVGAFRAQPLRRYEFRGRVADVADSVGENVVDALIEDCLRRGRKRGELLRGVNHWLKQVGRIRLLPLRRISKSARIFELRLKDTDSGRWANFADVGFGIGQAFPVLVEGLRTPLGGTFLVQEPEIHLHPDAELAMTDFLVTLVRSGRRVIVESHSENLLLRIRHWITGMGQGRRPLPRDDVSIIYVDKAVDGTSHTKVLHVDELGQIGNWPKSFMEDATQERMELLEAMARRAESGK